MAALDGDTLVDVADVADAAAAADAAGAVSRSVSSA